MPLTWDVDEAISREAPLLYAMADMLSETAGLRRLNDESTAEQARTKVKIGPPLDEWESSPEGKATPAQLQALRLRAELSPSSDNPHEATESDSNDCPNEGGTFDLEIVWWPSAAELEANDHQELYLIMLDCTSSIAHDLVQAARLYNRVGAARVTQPVGFGSRDSRSAKGVHLGVSMEIDWGDRGTATGGEG